MLKAKGLPNPKLGPQGKELYQNVNNSLSTYQTTNSRSHWLNYVVACDIFKAFLRAEESEGRHTTTNPTN